MKNNVRRCLIILSMWGLLWPLSSSGTGQTAHGALSQTSWTGEAAAAAGEQRSAFIANMMAPPPNIALKVQPARTLRFSKSQINGLLADLRHEVKSQVAVLEGEMAEEERQQQRTISTWVTHGSPIWVPKEAGVSLARPAGAEMSFLQRERVAQPLFGVAVSPHLTLNSHSTHPYIPSEVEMTPTPSAEAAATQAAAFTEGPLNIRQFID